MTTNVPDPQSAADSSIRKQALQTVNCLSVDVEGFVESNVQSFRISSGHVNPSGENVEIEDNVDALLELLDSTDVRATFFVVGRIARDIPHVVNRIASAGHEIGCHNYEHVRLWDVKREDLASELASAKHRLEDVARDRVIGFRAPDFSISSANLWALDTLRELGFEYDSSIYPIGMHDVYGMPNAKRFIHRLPNGLIEFPLSTIRVAGKNLPFGGGGYFRLYPLCLTAFCVARVNKQGHPCMCYVHPYEVGPVIPVVRGLSWYRRFRHYHNCNNGNSRLRKMLTKHRFGRAKDILAERGYLEEQ